MAPQLKSTWIMVGNLKEFF